MDYDLISSDYQCFCYGLKQFGNELKTIEKVINTYAFEIAARLAIQEIKYLDPGTYEVVVAKDNEEQVFKVTKHKPNITVLSC